MGQSANSQTFCRLCREPDHSAGQCALGYLQPPARNSSAPGTLPAPSSSRFARRRWDQRANLNMDSVGFWVRVNSGMYARYVSAPTWHGITEPLQRLQDMAGPWKVEEGQEWHLLLQLVLGLFFDWTLFLDMQTRLIVSHLGPALMLCTKIIIVIFVFVSCYCWVESSSQGVGTRVGCCLILRYFGFMHSG